MVRKPSPPTSLRIWLGTSVVYGWRHPFGSQSDALLSPFALPTVRWSVAAGVMSKSGWSTAQGFVSPAICRGGEAAGHPYIAKQLGFVAGILGVCGSSLPVVA